MGRPHIEFIQAQALPWGEDGLGIERPGVQVKMLSRDPDTGAISAIISYPPGWSGPAETLNVDEEFLVLDGSIAHGGVDYLPDCYGYWPAGFARKDIRSPGGARVLTFLQASSKPGSGFDADALIERIDIREGEWKADLKAMGLTVMAASARIRTLRLDPSTGAITYVTAAIPYWRETQPERHPVAQEIFVLAGEVSGNTGIMRHGAYTWRPENVAHGPYGSLTGAVMLFRSPGGAAFTTEHEPAVPFSFTPPHRPFLTAELEQVGRSPLPTAPRWANL